ncbi:MAG: hypothetical protein JWP51_1444 [Bradyrhizobium sp.]|nr:hypothetical protein [Bradyrhizobium sp.]
MLGLGSRFTDPAGEALKRLQVSMGVAGIDAAMRAAMTPIVEPVRDFSINQFRLPDPPKPEEFYYASWPTIRPVQKGALTCQLWRHQTDDEIFEFKVVFGKNGDARGVVECAVHADNLTEPRQAKVIVERKIESIGMFDLAEAMVDASG